ncbi:MAG: GNAT family N-acetyltransferase [Alphaproteobacteria bacterium]
MTVHIETERLIFREWKDEDRAPFARMNGDPIVMEYLPRSLDEAASNKLVDRFQEHFDRCGYGLYAVELKETGQFAGFVGLNNVEFKADFTPATELAWRLDYEFWGKGYGSEAARAALEHGLKKLKLKEIVSFTVHDNARSIHLMEKIGMKRDEKGGFDYPSLRAGHPLGRFVLYRS